MKKIIALTLVLVLCFGLVACGDTSNEPTMDEASTTTESNNSGILDLGKEWHSLSSKISISFNTEDTCTFGGSECKYEYNKAKSIVSIYDMYTVNLNLVINGDTSLLKTQDITFVPLAAYEQYDKAYLEAYIENHCVFSVASDNLAPALHKGESAFFKLVEDTSKVCVGDIISYWTVINGERTVGIGEIIDIEANDGGVFGLKVKKDTEGIGVIHSPEIIGKLVQVIETP